MNLAESRKQRIRGVQRESVTRYKKQKCFCEAHFQSTNKADQVANFGVQQVSKIIVEKRTKQRQGELYEDIGTAAKTKMEVVAAVS